jgi:hypothetical protein
MKNFLKPNRSTVKVWAILVALIIVLLVFGVWLKLNVVLFSLIMMLLWIPFKFFWFIFGPAVGQFGEFYGFPVPNALGYTLIIILDIVALYIIASLISLLLSKRQKIKNQ